MVNELELCIKTCSGNAAPLSLSSLDAELVNGIILYLRGTVLVCQSKASLD